MSRDKILIFGLTPREEAWLSPTFGDMPGRKLKTLAGPKVNSRPGSGSV